MKLANVANALIVTGAGALSAAGFAVHLGLGLAVAGAWLCLFGVAISKKAQP